MYENANKELGELIFQLAQGSMSAFEQIYKQTGKILYRLGNSYFTQRADVEDAVQDTYLEIYKKAGKFRDNQNACAWITKISQNLIKNRLKRRKRIDYRETEEIKNIFWKNGEEERILESRIFLSDLFKNLDCYERALLMTLLGILRNIGIRNTDGRKEGSWCGRTGTRLPTTEKEDESGRIRSSIRTEATGNCGSKATDWNSSMTQREWRA